MPDRVIRDEWLESEAINSLSWPAESFYLRLCLKADDYGRFHGDLRLLEAQLFPCKPAALTRDIEAWLSECEKAGLVLYYPCNGQPYLYIPKFRQRRRQTTPSKFPDPPWRFQIDPGGPCYTAHYPDIAHNVGGTSYTSPHLAPHHVGGTSYTSPHLAPHAAAIVPPSEDDEQGPPAPLDHPSLNRALPGEAYAWFLHCDRTGYSLEEITGSWVVFSRTSIDGQWVFGGEIVEDWRIAMARNMSDRRTKTGAALRAF